MSNLAKQQVVNFEYFVETDNTFLYGLQWGDPDSLVLLRQVRDLLLLRLTPEMTVLEIGSGGGRWSRYFVGKTKKAILVDGTPASEIAIRSRFDWPGFEFVVSSDGTLPIPDESLDLVFSYDTFVHFEPPLFEDYVLEVGKKLKPQAPFLLHYAKTYPEPCYNNDCFSFREDEEFFRLIDSAGLEEYAPPIYFRNGHGSILRQLRKKISQA